MWRISLMFKAIPYALPTFIVLAVIAVMTVSVVAWRRGAFAFAYLPFLLALGGVASATLTPSGGYSRGRHCALAGTGSWAPDFATLDGRLNVPLFIPLGITAGIVAALPQMSRRWAGRYWPSAVMLVLPVAIETAQYVVRSLGRICQGSDIVANLAGGIAGLIVGLLATAAWRTIARHPQQSTGSHPLSGREHFTQTGVHTHKASPHKSNDTR